MAKNKKGKAGVPKKKGAKPTFIEFSKLQQALLQEIMRRHQDELNAALNLVYDEIPEVDRDLPRDEVQYFVRQDMTGVDIRYPKDEEKVKEEIERQKREKEEKDKNKTEEDSNDGQAN